jgi:hypothetical protein
MSQSTDPSDFIFSEAAVQKPSDKSPKMAHRPSFGAVALSYEMQDMSNLEESAGQLRINQ